MRKVEPTAFAHALIWTATVLVAQSVERVTAEREVAGSILGARTNTQGLKISEK